MNKICVAITLAVCGLASAQETPTRTPAWFTAGVTQARAHYTDRMIVKFKSDAAVLPTAAQLDSRAKALSASAGAELNHQRSIAPRTQVLRLAHAMAVADVRAIADKLTANPDVEYAEPDYKMFPAFTPNDPGFSPGINFGGGQIVTQWYLSEATGGINAPTAWNTTRGSSTTTVAVVDTGVLNHPDLVGRLLPGYDFIGTDPNGTFETANDGDGRDSDATDPGNWITAAEAGKGNFAACASAQESDWHGTHVAGIIGANVNGSAIAGINHFAGILPVRALGKCGGYTSDIIDAMRWSAGIAVAGVPNNAHSAQILNLSLSIDIAASQKNECTRAMQDAINDVLLLGKTVVVAAGNSGPSVKSIPAVCAGVMSVSAMTRAGTVASYSYFGTETSVSAPGGLVTIDKNKVVDFTNGILSLNDNGLTTPLNDGAVTSLAGSSFSTAIVSGVASLLLDVNRNLTPAQIKGIIQSTARRPTGLKDLGLDCSIDSARPCYQYLVDAAAAIAAAQGPLLNTLDANGNPLSLLNFETTSPGSSSQTRQILVLNPIGAAFRIYDVKLAGKDNGDFQASTTCGNTSAPAYPFDLPPGASCSIDVKFKPSIEGVRAAEVVIASNVNIPVSVTGSGSGGSSGGGKTGGGCTMSRAHEFDPTLLLLIALSLIYFTARRLPRR